MDDGLDRGETRTDDSGTFGDGRTVFDLVCSLAETAIDRSESIENGEEGAATLWDELFPVSLFRYKGANIGGGRGYNEG